mgnify:CR=1 FL=1
MYFWFYQPRAQDAFRLMVRNMPEADRNVLARAQLVLTREREISQMLVDGLLGRNFSRPLAIFSGQAQAVSAQPDQALPSGQDARARLLPLITSA